MVAGLKLVIALLVIGYPLLVYLSLSYLDAKVLALVLILLAAARLACVGQDRRASSMLLALLLSLGSVAAIGFLVIVSGSPAFLRYYPVCMNAVMLLLVGLSLLRPPSMIERIARIREPNLPDAAVRYTRTVTEVWCLFFVLNGSAALYTALAADIEAWALYNGVIAYVLMGLLFAGEHLVRRRVQRGHPSAVDLR